jgi:uncharacterized protein YggE
MKTKTFVLSVVVLFALLLSACAASAPAAATRTLSINGAGQVSLKPDMAYVYVGVHTEKPSAAEAVAVNNASTQQLINALTAAGVAVDDIQTTNFSIWQSTQYGADGQPSGTYYAVDNTVYVTVRKLDSLGSLLDAAVKAGANNINSIQFDVADKTAALSQARAQAVQAAQKQAEELAAAAGVTLGAVQSIQYYDSSPVPVFDARGGAGAGMNAAMPINPGQLQITATVTMAYEIK